MEPIKKLKRACTAESKGYRKQTILDAATALFFEDPSSLPTVSEIAKRCGIAKGTVYIYFSTKEQIFLNIIEELFTEFIKSADTFVLNSIKSEHPIESIVNDLCDYSAENRTMVNLAGMSNSIIEHNIDIDSAYEYKKNIQIQLFGLGETMQKTLGYDKIFSSSLFLRTYAIILGVWQLCNPPKKVQQISKKEGAEFLSPDFRDELYSTLMPFWKGSISSL